MAIATQPKEISLDLKDSTNGEAKRSMFVLYYRQGMNPHPEFQFFFAEGDLRHIIERAKSFCEKVNYRFVKVMPAILDFDQEEKRRLGT